MRREATHWMVIRNGTYIRRFCRSSNLIGKGGRVRGPSVDQWGGCGAGVALVAGRPRAKENPRAAGPGGSPFGGEDWSNSYRIRASSDSQFGWRVRTASSDGEFGWRVRTARWRCRVLVASLVIRVTPRRGISATSVSSSGVFTPWSVWRVLSVPMSWVLSVPLSFVLWVRCGGARWVRSTPMRWARRRAMERDRCGAGKRDEGPGDACLKTGTETLPAHEGGR